MFNERDFLLFTEKGKSRTHQDKFDVLPFCKTPLFQGRLYKCKHHLVVYPSPFFAAKAFLSEKVGMAQGSACFAKWVKNYWNVESAICYWQNKLNCVVKYSDVNKPFMYIEGKLLRAKKSGLELPTALFLFSEFSGWIAYTSHAEIEQVE